MHLSVTNEIFFVSRKTEITRFDWSLDFTPVASFKDVTTLDVPCRAAPVSPHANAHTRVSAASSLATLAFSYVTPKVRARATHSFAVTSLGSCSHFFQPRRRSLGRIARAVGFPGAATVHLAGISSSDPSATTSAGTASHPSLQRNARSQLPLTIPLRRSWAVPALNPHTTQVTTIMAVPAWHIPWDVDPKMTK